MLCMMMMMVFLVCSLHSCMWFMIVPTTLFALLYCMHIIEVNTSLASAFSMLEEGECWVSTGFCLGLPKAQNHTKYTALSNYRSSDQEASGIMACCPALLDRDFSAEVLYRAPLL